MDGSGASLSGRRRELGLTLKDVAHAVGVSVGTVSRWESGKIVNMRRDRIAALARILQVPTSFIMGEASEAGRAPVGERVKGAAGESGAEVWNISSPRREPVPLLGRIAAGSPSYAEENVEGYEFPQSRVKADFCLEVRGDSMENAGIHTGDIVFIRRQPTVEEGEIAAVLVDGEATLKRFYRHGDAVELRPENSRYKSMFFTQENCSQFKILGKAVALQTML